MIPNLALIPKLTAVSSFPRNVILINSLEFSHLTHFRACSFHYCDQGCLLMGLGALGVAYSNTESE